MQSAPLRRKMAELGCEFLTKISAACRGCLRRPNHIHLEIGTALVAHRRCSKRQGDLRPCMRMQMAQNRRSASACPETYDRRPMDNAGDDSVGDFAGLDSP
jgi:hypothetical protein